MKILLTSIAALTVGASAFAQVVETDQSANSQTAFDGNILANDLINNGSPDVSSVTTNGSVSGYAGDVAPYNSFSNLTDGAASTKVNNNDISHDTYFDGGSFATNPSITYHLNIGANPGGYSITSIQSILGWADTTSFSNQKYNVSYSTVSSPGTFTPLTSVNYAPFSGNGGNPNSSDVLLTGTGGAPLATNVAALQFAFLDNGGSGQVFREIDVLGTSAVPEPGTWIAAGGLLLLAAGDFRRRLKA